jgi:hypothetical protein
MICSRVDEFILADRVALDRKLERSNLSRVAQSIPTKGLYTVEEDNIEPPPHYDEVEGPQVVTSDTARQGPLGSRVLVVLIGGLIAVCLAFAAVYWFSYR